MTAPYSLSPVRDVRVSRRTLVQCGATAEGWVSALDRGALPDVNSESPWHSCAASQPCRECHLWRNVRAVINASDSNLKGGCGGGGGTGSPGAAAAAEAAAAAPTTARTSGR
jgi:hypothetical protein